MSSFLDVLVPASHDLFWKKVGNGGWLYNGPVVFSAPDRYSRGERKQKLGTVVGAVPDDSTTLWLFCWGDAFTEDEKVAVKDHLVQLPLRFRGQVYEECVSRAKQHLADRLFPDLPQERRLNVTWKFDTAFGSWTLDLGGKYNWTFGDGEGSRHTRVDDLDAERDPCVALAAAIKATDAAR